MSFAFPDQTHTRWSALRMWLFSRFLCSNVTEKYIKIKQTFVESIIYSVYLIQNAKKKIYITTGGKYTNNVNPYLKIAMGIQHCPECVM